MRRRISLGLVLIYLMTVFTGCGWSRTGKGAVIGATAGGAIGGVIGSKSKHTVLGAIIGAAVGGAAGAAIGRYMDKQAAELQRDLEHAKVERVGEGIKITFESGILFDTDSYKLKPAAEENIRDLARVLQKYKDTNVLIEGHTDNTGTKAHNQVLSEKRAEAVAFYAATQGVSSGRFSKIGYADEQPVADNSTTEGRQKNRRVEIAIIANKKLKKAAEDGKLDQ